MSYTIAFNTNGGAAMADVTAAADAWADVPAALPGEFLSGRTFDGWIVTGHDRRTAVYSADGGATETALDSDPALVAQDGAIKVKNLAADGGLVQMTARWRVRFGRLNAGCPSVWVAPFTPICAKGGVDGSTPLTLDVPSPVFAPYIPPPECACFLFDSPKTANVNVTMSPGNTMKAKGTAKVDISSVGDCCDGKYEVTPTITIDIPECVTPDEEHENTLPIGPNGNGTITYKWGIRNCVPFFEMSSVPFDLPTILVSGFCLADTDFTIKATYKLPGEDSDAAAHEIDSKTVNLTAGDAPGNTGCKQYKVGDIELDLSDFAFGNNGDVYKDGNTGNLIVGGILDSNDDVQWWYGGGAGDYGDDSRIGKYVYQRGPTMRGVADETDPPTHFPLVYDEPEYKLMDDPGHAVNTRWRSENKDGTDPYGKPETEGEKWATGNLDMVLPSGFQWDSKPITRGVSVVMSEFAWNPGGLLCSEEEKKWALVLAPGIVLWKDDATISYDEDDDGDSDNDVLIDVGGMNASGLTVMKTPRNEGQQPGLAIYDGGGLRVFGADGKTYEGEVAVSPEERVGQLEVYDGVGLRVFGADIKTDDGEVTADTAGRLGQLEVYAHDGDFKFNYDGRMVMNDEAATDADTVKAPIAGSAKVGSTTKTYLLVGTQTSTAQGPVSTPRSFIRDTEAHMSVVVASGVAPYWGRVISDTGILQIKTSDNATALNAASTAYNRLRAIERITEDNYLNAIADMIAMLIPVYDAAKTMNYAMGTLGIVNVDVARSGVITNISESKNNDIPRRYVEEQPSGSQGSSPAPATTD